LQCIEEESFFLTASTQTPHSRSSLPATRARQQSAEVSTHGARTNDGTFGQPGQLGHGVTTLMSRSMSRSVLYKCGIRECCLRAGYDDILFPQMLVNFRRVSPGFVPQNSRKDPRRAAS